MTLDQLPLNRKGEILSVNTNLAVAQRLMAMGFLPGMQVKVVKIAPFGDPIMVELEGWRMSLCASEAALVGVEPLPSAED